MENCWVLVTGGLGYIGSHVCVELCLQGFNVIIVDLMGKHSLNVFDNMKKIVDGTGAAAAGQLKLKYCDLVKEELHIPHRCDVIIHLAALKSVPESVEQPLLYYEHNLRCLFTVLNCAKLWGNEPAFVFSSSATVYGYPVKLPITEKHPINPTNPYGETKVICEQLLRKLSEAMSSPIGTTIILRYFNPVGAHPSGLIGESPTSGNLMAAICRTLGKEDEVLNVYGRGHGTIDGTQVRDYLHVMDLAMAHIAAVKRAIRVRNEYLEINLGRGKGISVQQMITTMESVTGLKIPVFYHSHARKGDVDEVYASNERASIILGWKAERTIADMCEDAGTITKK